MFIESANKCFEGKEAWQNLGKDQKEENPKKSLYKEKDDPNKTVEIIIEGLFEKKEEKKLKPKEKKPDPPGSELKINLSELKSEIAGLFLDIKNKTD